MGHSAIIPHFRIQQPPGKQMAFFFFSIYGGQEKQYRIVMFYPKTHDEVWIHERFVEWLAGQSMKRLAVQGSF